MCFCTLQCIYDLFNCEPFGQICIKRSSLEQRKGGFLRQVTS